MVAYVFDNILAKGVRSGQIPARSVAARDWFRSEAQSTSTTGSKVISTSKGKAVRDVSIGNMYLFNYDPKAAAPATPPTLPALFSANSSPLISSLK